MSRKKKVVVLAFLLPSVTWRKDGSCCKEQVGVEEGQGIKSIFSPILPTVSGR